MNLPDLEKAIYNATYLRVLMQRSIEVMDDLRNSNQFDGKLRTKMNDLFQVLDKRTKTYDELFKATPDGMSAYYQAVCTNVEACLRTDLPDQVIIAQMLTAFYKDEKSVLGIIKKVNNQDHKKKA